MIISYSAFYLLSFNFSSNIIITINNKLWIITEYKFLEISRMPSHADMNTKELSAAFYWVS